MSISCLQVGVAYGEIPVVQAVDLVVPRGGWTTLIGANGAGKSSLLRAVAGLVHHEGEVRLADRLTAATTRRQIARLVAFVPQRPMLPETMTVADYVHLGRMPHAGLLGREDRHDAEVVGAVLERLELEEFATRRLGEISGGEGQRAVLARALAQQSEILILDEPTTALDLGHQQRILDLVDELRHERGLTVLSSSHDLGLAGQFAEELILLAHGRVVASGPPQAVLTVELLAAHYGARVEIREDSTGRVIVVPLRSPSPVLGNGLPN
jgi:iron complex transport system ATP-binding protein